MANKLCQFLPPANPMFRISTTLNEQILDSILRVTTGLLPSPQYFCTKLSVSYLTILLMLLHGSCTLLHILHCHDFSAQNCQSPVNHTVYCTSMEVCSALPWCSCTKILPSRRAVPTSLRRYRATAHRHSTSALGPHIMLIRRCKALQQR